MIYSVLIPIAGYMEVYVNSNNGDREKAIAKGKEIATEMWKKSKETIIPNLNTWKIVQNDESILVIERGEADE